MFPFSIIKDRDGVIKESRWNCHVFLDFNVTEDGFRAKAYLQHNNNFLNFVNRVGDGILRIKTIKDGMGDPRV